MSCQGENLQVAAVADSSSAINVTITPADGQSHSYTIKFIGEGLPVIVKQTANFLHQDNLQPNVEYAVIVTADNYGDGYKTVKTWPGGMSVRPNLTIVLAGVPPTNLNVTVTGTDTIEMSWKNPEKPGGDITHFDITITTSGEEPRPRQVPLDEKLPITITGLTPFKQYDATIVTTNAKTTDGHGGGPGASENFGSFRMWPGGCLSISYG